MKNRKLSARGAHTWLAAACLTWTLAAVGACSSDDDNPAPNTGGTGAKGGSGGGSQSGGAKSGNGGTGTGGASSEGGTGDTGPGGTGEGGSGEAGGATNTGAGAAGGAADGGTDSGGTNAGGAAGQGGTGDTGSTCPATDLEFLNRPNTSQCSKFPNTKARLPGLNADGSLPSLPGA
jgi:hypothetical protein